MPTELHHTTCPLRAQHSSRREAPAAIILAALAGLASPLQARSPPPTPTTARTTAPAATQPLVGPIPLRKPPPKKRHFSWFNPTTWPVLPVPLIAVGPNTGTTLGILPTWLGTNSESQITEIIAPDIMRSQYFGWGGHARILAYPSENTEWSLLAGAEQRVESTFDGVYETGLLRQSRFSFSADANYDRSGTPRFYGIGNDSLQINQTVYRRQRFLVTATLGWNITPTWQLAYTFAARKETITPGALPGVPSITSRFAGTVGIGTTHDVLNRIAIVYDTRNNVTIPTRGMYLVLYGGAASRNFQLANSLYTEAGGDGRFYWSPNPSLTIATHVDLRYEPTAHDVPFWALSSLGGDQSLLGGSQPLRGFGTARFYDRDSFVANIEFRQNVLSMNMLGTHVILQVAPLFDTGRVFDDADAWPISHLHNVFGVGFRGIAAPSVVGYVDVGAGSEGLAIFTGVNYPF